MGEFTSKRCVCGLRCCRLIFQEGEDTDAVERQIEDAMQVEEVSAQERYRATDDTVRLQRVFPAGTVMHVKAYDPAASGFGEAAVSGDRLSKLILGCREMFRCVARRHNYVDVRVRSGVRCIRGSSLPMPHRQLSRR